jgi:antitoxin ChpS
MATATLRTLGGSVVMTIPKSILEQAHLRSGAQVEIEYRDGHLVVEPRAKPKYTLAELLARCDAGSLAPAAEDDEWLNDGPVGKEAL